MDVKVKHKKTGVEQMLPKKAYEQLSDKYILLEKTEQKVVTPNEKKVADAGKPTKENKPEEKKEDLTEDEKLAELRKKYEEMTGEKPHGRTKAETLIAKIEELNAAKNG